MEDAVNPLEDLEDRLTRGLQDTFGMQRLWPYTVVVEGLTDVEYLQVARDALLDEIGFDLFSIDGIDRGDDNEIKVLTPTTPRHPDPEKRLSGGVPQVGRLAKFLGGFFPVLEVDRRLCFVLDHDEAGLGCIKTISSAGFDTEYTTLTLDPNAHPGACAAQDDVVIEDLLSLVVQRDFFDRGGCFCRVTYEEGEPVRFVWNGSSKSALPGFVKSQATLEHLYEVVRLLCRARELWGLVIPAY